MKMLGVKETRAESLQFSVSASDKNILRALIKPARPFKQTITNALLLIAAKLKQILKPNPRSSVFISARKYKQHRPAVSTLFMQYSIIVLFCLLAGQPVFSQEQAIASGSWSWPKINVPSLASISVSLPVSLASLTQALPDKQDFSDALASGVVKGLFSFREVASAAFDMARDDLEKHATWHYRVVDLQNDAPPEELEKQLTELGKDKWELVSITPLPTKTRFYFKKRGISLLRLLAPVLNPEK